MRCPKGGNGELPVAMAAAGGLGGGDCPTRGVEGGGDDEFLGRGTLMATVMSNWSWEGPS